MNFETILNDDLLFTAFLTTIIVLSLIFNTISIYNFYDVKKKISADYIKFQIWLINLVFTLVAIPYYILKEINLIENNSLLCNVFYAFSDGIMFVYNNMLILMALDRYFFICTKVRFHDKNVMPIFYFISLSFASTSVIRLFQKDCSVIAKPVNDRFNETVVEDLLLVIYRDYFVTSVISLNMSLTFILYIRIIYFVYKKSTKAQSYRPVKQITKETSPNLKVASCSTENNSSRVEEDARNLSIKEMKTNKSNFFKYSVKKKNKAIHYKLFKNTKHWIVTITFMKVSLFHLWGSSLYQFYRNI